MTEQAAFDQIADDYDLSFTNTEVGKRQRARVHAYLAPWLSDSRPLEILELNCGTGEDAIWMAHQGHKVLATDISLKMVEVGEGKTRFTGNVEFAPLSILHALRAKKWKYDLVFSNFGGFNCLPPEELRMAAEMMKTCLKPGGRFVAVVMPRKCVWETLYFLAKFRFRKAFRRGRRKPLEVALAGGAVQQTWYYGPREMKHHFGDYLKYETKRPIGYFLPPSYLDPFFSKRPRLLSMLDKMERGISKWAFLAGWSDHCLLEFINE